jgi:sterol desaturase/sphingolipid hydroxylase (fatty acid hydroxylase superfamily)
MIGNCAVAAWIVGLLWWEHKRFLRRVVDSKLERDLRNLAIAAGAAAATQLLEAPVAIALANRSQRRGTGLLQLPWLPRWIKPASAILLLDYTLYIWHRLTHVVPVLWRFHKVHHLDREMDASTAVRFHFGEITLSVAFRAAQIRVIGPSASVYRAWQTFLMLCILFHHANIRLPLLWERRIARILVTPRLHGIHHSISASEVNSNWSSGLTVWDWLHGTLRARVPQHSIVIGVEGCHDDRSQALAHLLLLPFIEPANTIRTDAARPGEPVSALEA